MTSGVCSRCGASGMVEYGSDGQMYCSSCSFYGLNKQCYRCRMYLPASELQQYRGQWSCPNCIQDLRSEDRKAEEHVQERPHVDAIQYPEQCDRCGKDLKGRVYIWNGRKLCKSCVQDEQEKWGTVGGGPMAAPYRITLGPEKKRKKMSIIESIISEILHILGIRKKKELEIIVVNDRMPIGRAKPMAETALAGAQKEKDSRKPQAEGLMESGKTDGQKTAPAPPAPVQAPAEAAALPSGELSRVVPAKRQAKKKRGKGKSDSAPMPAAGQKKRQ
jgi:hypothetical protein